MRRLLGCVLVVGCAGGTEAPDGCDRVDVDRDGVNACSDCNDADDTVFPGAVERCNGIDDDCDTTIDEDASDATHFVDADADGFGAGTTPTQCADDPAAVETSGDCDDAVAAVNPAAVERWNGVDDDCDGAVDRVGVSVVQRSWLHGSPGDALGSASRVAWGGDLWGDGDDALVMVRTTRDRFGVSKALVVPLGDVPAGVQPLSAWVDVTVDRDCSMAAAECQATGLLIHAIDGVQGPFRDLTGDGVADLVLTTWVGVDGSGEGEVLVLQGGAMPASVRSHSVTTIAYPLADNLPEPYLPGPRLAVAADLDDDGVIELVVSGRTDGFQFLDQNPYGSITWFDDDLCLGETCPASALRKADEVGRLFGARGDSLGSLLTVGDVNGDGIDDVIAGAPGVDVGGAILVFEGGAPLADIADDTSPVVSGNGDAAVWGSMRGAAGMSLGSANDVLAVGALTDDAFDDVAVSDAGSLVVAVWQVTSGVSPGAVRHDEDVTRITGLPDSGFGASLCMADGWLFVGAPTARDAGGVETGAVYVFAGSQLADVGVAAVDASRATAVVYGEQASARFGATVLCGVDISGDGRLDLAVGSPGWNLPDATGGPGAVALIPMP